MVDDDVPLAVGRLALPELQHATEHMADRLLQTELVAAGGSPALATGVTVLPCQGDVLDLVELAAATGVPAEAVVDALSGSVRSRGRPG